MDFGALMMSVGKVTVVLIFSIVILYIIFKSIVGNNSAKVGLFFKYKIFRAKFNKKIMEDSVIILEKEKDITPLQFAKLQMIKYGYPPRKVAELMYIFTEVKQHILGGEKSGKQRA